MATSTRSSVCASATVSFSRHRYSSVTAGSAMVSASLVFTEPTFGAFAMMTSVRFVGVMECVAVRSIFKKASLHRNSRRPWHADFPSAEIVAHNKTKNEPSCSHGASKCSADFRLPDAWMIAHRDLNDAQAVDDPLKDQFHGPPVRSFFKFDLPKRICARGAERTKVGDLHSVEALDQTRGEPIAEQGVPGKRPGRARACETRTNGDVGSALGDRGKKERELRRPITVVAI